MDHLYHHYTLRLISKKMGESREKREKVGENKRKFTTVPTKTYFSFTPLNFDK